MKKSIAIIIARGGSKRIPSKNIKCFHGKPIISYVIEHLRMSKLFERIVVSTDSEEVKNIALSEGAEVPFSRPQSLSDDHAGTLEVLQHCLEFLEKNDSCFDRYERVCLAYPTAVNIDSETVIDGYRSLDSDLYDSAVTVVNYSKPIQRALRLVEGQCLEFKFPEYRNARSQDLEDLFFDAGQIYWFKKSHVFDAKSLWDGRVAPIVLEEDSVCDIDWPADWLKAEKIYLASKKVNYKKPVSGKAILKTNRPND